MFGSYFFLTSKQCFSGKQFNGRLTWDEFFEQRVHAVQQAYGPQYDWLLDWDTTKTKGDILFLKYEDLKADITTGIKKIASFLGYELSEAHLEKIVHDTDIKQMKSGAILEHTKLTDPSDLIRTGQIGEWKKYFTVEQNEWFDREYKKLYEELSIDVAYY